MANMEGEEGGVNLTQLLSDTVRLRPEMARGGAEMPWLFGVTQK